MLTNINSIEILKVKNKFETIKLNNRIKLLYD